MSDVKLSDLSVGERIKNPGMTRSQLIRRIDTILGDDGLEIVQVYVKGEDDPVRSGYPDDSVNRVKR